MPETRGRRAKKADIASTSNFITNLTGDLTADPPKNAVLIHSVNCASQWGSGVALALAKKFPAAFKVYQEECKKSPEELLGACYLIPPQVEEDDTDPRWIACLFVSEGYGTKTKTKPGKGKPADITRYTKTALEALRKELETYSGTPGNGPDVKELWACKFNSGSFGVKWERTVMVIEEVFEDWKGGQMKVVSYE
jgi:ADP-ribose 1''-phosphate phosphatase